MPGMLECLHRLRDAGLRLGIVSNAQFYTPLLFPALVERSIEQCGFEPDLCVFSFEHGVAKPGTAIYDRAIERLAGEGIAPAETLYVGNDMLNDIAPAAALGMRTALFAGDGRSLRWRENDARVAGLSADLILTDLAALPA
jgi:putative hydrolase of the HAD superfamily